MHKKKNSKEWSPLLNPLSMFIHALLQQLVLHLDKTSSYLCFFFHPSINSESQLVNVTFSHSMPLWTSNCCLCPAGGAIEPLSLWRLSTVYSPVLPYTLDKWERIVELWAVLLQVPGSGHQHQEPPAGRVSHWVCRRLSSSVVTTHVYNTFNTEKYLFIRNSLKHLFQFDRGIKYIECFSRYLC